MEINSFHHQNTFIQSKPYKNAFLLFSCTFCLDESFLDTAGGICARVCCQPVIVTEKNLLNIMNFVGEKNSISTDHTKSILKVPLPFSSSIVKEMVHLQNT